MHIEIILDNKKETSLALDLLSRVEATEAASLQQTEVQAYAATLVQVIEDSTLAIKNAKKDLADAYDQ